MPINIKRNVYTMASADGQSAEVTMYGDIYETTPIDWWTGKPKEGQFITLQTFMDDLKEIQGCSTITIRMNSYGGDAGVSNTIHNRLRELARGGASLVCIVDGVAMSGGSIIMSACDTVEANPSSLIMIHKCWCFFFGCYNADELRQAVTSSDAWDKMQVECYKRKTGMSDEEILGMMAETTYMTGREAMEKGFVDKLLEDAEPANIAASASGNCLFVNGRKMHLAPGMSLPDGIPMVETDATASVVTNTPAPATSGENEGGNTMATTPTTAQVETPATTSQTAEASTATPAVDAAQAERTRIQEIDDIAHLFSADLVKEAKYGESPCSAQELAFRAAQAASKNGTSFLSAVATDNAESGVQQVASASASVDEDEPKTEKGKFASAKAQVRDLLGIKKEDN